MVYEQDYILRLIQNAGQALRRIMELVHLGKGSSAVEEADALVTLILGVDSKIADAMTTPSMLTFVRTGADLDTRRALLLARALLARAESRAACADDAGADADAARAREIASAVVAEGMDTEREEARSVAEAAEVWLNSGGAAPDA